MTTPINLAEKFSLFSEHWRPKVIARLNNQEIKIIKVQGEFPWHHHENEDEFFLVWKGRFRIEFRDHIVTLDPGECLVVPAVRNIAPAPTKKLKSSASNQQAS